MDVLKTPKNSEANLRRSGSPRACPATHFIVFFQAGAISGCQETDVHLCFKDKTWLRLLRPCNGTAIASPKNIKETVTDTDDERREVLHRDSSGKLPEPVGEVLVDDGLHVSASTLFDIY